MQDEDHNTSKNRCSELSKDGEGQKSTNAPWSGKKGLKRRERGRAQLKTCEVASAQRFSSDSEVLQSEH